MWLRQSARGRLIRRSQGRTATTRMAAKYLKPIALSGLATAFSFCLPMILFASTIYGSGAYGSGTYAGSAPTVTTDSSSAVTQTSATVAGSITSIGSTSPSVRGFVYGTGTTYGATTTDNAGPFSNGSFSAAISGLTCSTGYHFAAYATSTNGIGYGGDLTFTTSACSSGGGGGGGGAVSPPVSSGGNGPIVGSLSSVGNPSSVGGIGGNATTSATSSGPFFTGYTNPLRQAATSTISQTVTVSKQPSSNTSSLPRNLQLNDRGEDIRALQRLLNAAGFYIARSGIGSPGNETTLFGKKTYDAVVKFQIAHYLPATGYVGPKTRAALGQ
jgi:hypothetical protein